MMMMMMMITTTTTTTTTTYQQENGVRGVKRGHIVKILLNKISNVNSEKKQKIQI